MRNKTAIAIAALLVIAVVMAAIAIFVSHRPTKTPAEAQSAPVQRAPKPSPAVRPNESKPPEPTSPAPIAVWPPDGMQLAAHHKGFHGCNGVLILKAYGLEFRCPDDSGKSFAVALSDIRGMDKDGIVTTDGSKYHFDKLAGGGKEYTVQLFADWLDHVRTAK